MSQQLDMFLDETFTQSVLDKRRSDVQKRELEEKRLKLEQGFYGDFQDTRSNQFFTPLVAARLMAGLADIKAGDVVLDTCCGSGVLLYACAEKGAKLFGVEIDHTVSEIAAKQLDSFGAVIRRGNLLEDPLELPSADVVIINPPYGKPRYNNEQGFKFNKSLDTMFLEDALLKRLKKGGRLVAIVPNSLLSNNNTRNFRSWILDNFTYRATIDMPSKLFYKKGAKKWEASTSTNTGIMIVDKIPPEERPSNYGIVMACLEKLELLEKESQVILDTALPKLRRGVIEAVTEEVSPVA